MSSNTDTIRDLAQQEYKWGFVTDIETDRVPKGLNEDIIRLISAQEKRAGIHARVAAEGLSPLADAEKAQAEPKWANVHLPPIDYQDIIYYSAPKQKAQR